MEPAGLSRRVVLGHENAGWVHAVGADVTDGRGRRRGARLSAVQLRALRRLPPRPGHALRPAPVHRPDADGGFADYVLVDERSLMPLPAGVEPAAVAPHADAGITAYPRDQAAPRASRPGRPRR